MKPASSSKQAIYLRAWRARNAGKSATYSQRYRETSGLDNEQSKRWYDANKEAKAKQTRQYRQTNPEVIEAASSKRREGLRGRGGHTALDIRTLLIHQATVCAYCGDSLYNGYHVDHIVPVVKGGSNNRENLQLLCPQCNGRKGSLLDHEFRAKLIAEGLQPLEFGPATFLYATNYSAPQYDPLMTKLLAMTPEQLEARYPELVALGYDN